MQVSYVGMLPQEVAISPTIRVTLKADTKQLDELVVTAMGLKRSDKSLGYAASTVKSSDLNAAAPVSVMSGLTGKVAGLTISQSGGTGTSQKVILRGISSFLNNQPLYVVDGVPVLNEFSGRAELNNAVDYGSQAGDINPEDIESVTVLKGASASALYGSRAANGVIVITTKRGAQNQKLTVSYNGAFTASNVLRVPQTQEMFGQGWPLWDSAENGSWGPKLNGNITHEWGAEIDGVARTKPFSFVKNNVRNFYETGMEYTNDISISAGNKNSSFIMSYGNVSSDGILPGNNDMFKRNSFSFRGNTTFNKFSASFDVNYVRKDITQLSASQNGIYAELLQYPVDINYQDLKDYNNPYNDVNNYYTWYANNPYWMIGESGNKYQDDRVYGKVELDYDIIKGLKAIGRLGGDFTNSRESTWVPIMTPAAGSYREGDTSPEQGTYEEIRRYRGQIDFTALLDADFKLSEDFRLTGTAGMNYNQRDYSYIDAYQGNLNVPEWYNLQNGNDKPETSSYREQRRLVGVLGQFDLSFRDWLYWGVSARNDWSSTLPPDENSFFYWGTTASVIITDMVKSLQETTPISFLKLRGGWGQTGNDAPIYRTLSTYVPTSIGLGFGSVILPLGGVAGLTESNVLGNMGLKPEITTETEVGLDVRFFNNRLGLEASYYDRMTKDQIITANLPPETGFQQRTRNIGQIQNQGLELRLYGTPVQTKDFTWDSGVTFYKNKSNVKKLWNNPDGSETTRYDITSFYSVVYFSAIVGQPIGTFTVPNYVTVADGDHKGKIVVNSAGIPQIKAGTPDKIIGDSNPEFTMGFTNRLTYKNLSLNFVLDWRKGGVFYSNTARMMMWNGNAPNTTFNERQPFLVPNTVKEVSPGVYVENDIPVMTTAMYNYYNGTNSNKSFMEQAVLSRSFVKLREISLSYMMPKHWFAGTPISSLQVAMIGRNLLMFTPNDNRYVDPENSNYGLSLTSEAGEFSAAPGVRNLGGSIKIVF